ncbi:MAG: hypothetical protein HWE11_01435 [Gammaproteobacteria bacterium]|nr:hypothetical protein [Gammaproteobacteria bacterium]
MESYRIDLTDKTFGKGKGGRETMTLTKTNAMLSGMIFSAVYCLASIMLGEINFFVLAPVFIFVILFFVVGPQFVKVKTQLYIDSDMKSAMVRMLCFMVGVIAFSLVIGGALFLYAKLNGITTDELEALIISIRE